jgi:hypothetical protein
MKISNQGFQEKEQITKFLLRVSAWLNVDICNLVKTSSKKVNPNLSNIVTQTFPNENIFTNENYYKMNQFLNFENNIEERNCKLDLLVRNIGPLNIVVIFSLFKSIFFLFYYWSSMSYFIILLNLIDLLMMILVELMIIKVEQIHLNEVYLRFFLEIDIWVVLISKSFFETYTINMIPLIYFFCTFYNIVFVIPADMSMGFLTSETLILLLRYDHESSYFFVRFVRVS